MGQGDKRVEQIIDNDSFVRELTGLIVSADEETVASNPIKFLVVGTPTNIMAMMSRVSNANTIANRFIEIPEVARLELGESRYIMSQGFEKYLQFTILVDKNNLYKSISFVTDGIAQHVQELCLKIAENAVENNRTVNEAVVRKSEKEWLDETLSADKSAVINHMNSLETKVGRKNQVMYCLGQVAKEDVRYGDIEKMVREIFDVNDSTNLNIPQILSDFQKGGSPIVKRSTRTNHFSFCSPKTRMVIRSLLILSDDKKVQIR